MRFSGLMIILGVTVGVLFAGPRMGGDAAMALTLSSPVLKMQGMIPGEHTCDGLDTSPPLEWANPPAGTRSFALIVDDPDAPAGTWVHWVLYNLPENERGLPEGVAPNEQLPDGSRQGVNDFQKVGYGGSCPPGGAAHRYFFRLYALDLPLPLSDIATARGLRDVMKGHILGEALLVGRYGR